MSSKSMLENDVMYHSTAVRYTGWRSELTIEEVHKMLNDTLPVSLQLETTELVWES